MNDRVLSRMSAELSAYLTGRKMGGVFQLGKRKLAIDFHPHEKGYLFISIEPNDLRIYLIRRKSREIKSQSVNPLPFALTLSKCFGHSIVESVSKVPGDRILRIRLARPGMSGGTERGELVIQLTGRGANLFVLDEAMHVIDVLVPSPSSMALIGKEYSPPSPGRVTKARELDDMEDLDDLGHQRAHPPAEIEHSARPPELSNSNHSLSEELDAFYRGQEAERSFDLRVTTVQARIARELERRRKLERNLIQDLQAHGDAGEHKRLGEMLLANLGTAEPKGGIVRLRDYRAGDYGSGDVRFVELEIGETSTLKDEAARRFALYTKAKHAAQEISKRLEEVRAELVRLQQQRAALDGITAQRDEEQLRQFEAEVNPRERLQSGPYSRATVSAADGRRPERNTPIKLPGIRAYESSDGYQILVGRAAKDNDYLTFRVARPSDLWLHAADYPGSHVVIRNPQRKEIPQRTIIEAAQLAAKFSQANEDSKVAIHYAWRKFVTKPKRAAPGLVSMSTHRTMLAPPLELGTRLY